jgi:hypothetical protein
MPRFRPDDAQVWIPAFAGMTKRGDACIARTLGVERMSKTEKIIVGVFLAGVCPALVFVACWWTAAAVHLCMAEIGEQAIAVAALSGLAAGVVLDMLFLARWIRSFYTAGRGWMGGGYAALFVAAGAMFMGMPVGTFGLGILAGVYAGRRHHHGGSEEAAVRRALRRVAFVTALLTAGAALPIGILGLGEPIVVDLVRKVPGVEPSILRGASGVAMVCLFCVVLFAAQYGCSLLAGWRAFRMGER